MTYSQNNVTDGTEADIAAIAAVETDHQAKFAADAEYRRQIVIEALEQLKSHAEDALNALKNGIKNEGILAVMNSGPIAASKIALGPLQGRMDYVRSVVEMAREADGN